MPATLSDGRFKEGVQENVPGLAFIRQLRPVTYQLNRERVNEFIGVNERCRSSRWSSNNSKRSMSIFNARSGN